MDDAETVQVNFTKPFPLFPLETPALLPHGVVQLYIFEQRYRQLISDELDGAGQIAMAVFEGDEWKDCYHGSPPVRPVVCIGRIARHQQMPDDTYHVWLQGVCRARIARELAVDENRLYRRALLEPMRTREMFDDAALETRRSVVLQMLRSAPLGRSQPVRRLVEQLEEHQEQLPAEVMLELVAATLLGDHDREFRYDLLAEANPEQRARLIERELGALQQLLRRAAAQYDPEAPTGISWN